MARQKRRKRRSHDERASVVDRPRRFAIRPLVRHYLYESKLKRVEQAAAVQVEAARSARDAARVSADQASGAKARATAALIIAAGAMLAPMAAALIAFLALRKYGFEAPW
jgi:hypothetical protein